MRYEVLLTEGAEQDLAQLHAYIAESDSPQNADRVLDQVLAIAEKLAVLPNSGTHPKELVALGIREYRQVFFKPYRVIYRVLERRVYIHVIVDGRRDLQSLLARRLLGAQR